MLAIRHQPIMAARSSLMEADAAGTRDWRTAEFQLCGSGPARCGTADDTAAIQTTYNVSTEVTVATADLRDLFSDQHNGIRTPLPTATTRKSSQPPGRQITFHLASNIDRLTFYDLLLWSSVTKNGWRIFPWVGYRQRPFELGTTCSLEGWRYMAWERSTICGTGMTFRWVWGVATMTLHA